MKKGKWSPVKEILFTYLAVNKIMYWFNTITALNQSDIGNVGRAVFMRLLNQDLLLIIGVIAFFFLDKLIYLKKSRYNNILITVIFYAIGYVGLMAIAFSYNLIINLIFSAESFPLGEFVRLFMGFMPSATLGYIVVAAVLEIKQFFKAKEKKTSADAIHDTEDKLTMLKALFDDGILAQEEFEHKKLLITSVNQKS